jgi:hypothetical protein
MCSISGSMSFTRASTLNDACSSALKVASSVHMCQPESTPMLVYVTKGWFPWDINYGGRRTVSTDQCARLSIKYIKMQMCFSRSSSSLGGNKKFQESHLSIRK